MRLFGLQSRHLQRLIPWNDRYDLKRDGWILAFCSSALMELSYQKILMLAIILDRTQVDSLQGRALHTIRSKLVQYGVFLQSEHHLRNLF